MKYRVITLKGCHIIEADSLSQAVNNYFSTAVQEDLDFYVAVVGEDLCR